MRREQANLLALLLMGAACSLFYLHWARTLLSDGEPRSADLIFVGFLLGMLAWGMIMVIEFKFYANE